MGDAGGDVEEKPGLEDLEKQFSSEKPSFLCGLGFKKQSKTDRLAASVAIFPAVIDPIRVFLLYGLFQFIQSLQFSPFFFFFFKPFVHNFVSCCVACCKYCIGLKKI